MAMQTMKEVCQTRKTPKERASLSTTTLNGLRATEDGIKSMNGLSNISVTKAMLCCVKDLHKAYLEPMER